MPAAPAPHAPNLAPLARWELWTLGLLLAGFMAVSLNNINNLAFIGQDFAFHLQCTSNLLADPGAWFTRDATNRPLIYWIALSCRWLAPNQGPFQLAAIFFALCHTGALWLTHDSLRRLVATPLLRIAALAFVAFLPATLIAAVVFAADAMALPLFVLTTWSFIRWSETTSAGGATAYALLTGLALSAGHFAKATFIFLPAAVLVIALVLWRYGRITRARFLPLLALGVVAPAMVGTWLHAKAQRAVAALPAWHKFDWHGTGELTWQSLLLVKPSDRRILDAPGYWDFVERDGQQFLPLLAPNSYSYPALLHLGTFTDVLDFANQGSNDRGVPRPEPQKLASQWAVRFGLLFSLPACAAIVMLIGRSAGALVRPPLAPRTGVVIWLGLGLAWFLPVVLALPFVHHAYDWGYWLPRLVIPSLWCFGFGLFALLDERLGARRWGVGFVVAATLVQTCLHVRSVWY